MDTDSDQGTYGVNHSIIISIRGEEIDCSNSNFLLESNAIKYENTNPFVIDMEVSEDEFSLISKFLRKKKINIDSKDKYKLFKELNNSIQLPYLSNKLHLYKQNQKIQMLCEFNDLMELYHTIISFHYNLEETIERSSEIILHTGTKLFVRTVFYAILANPNRTDDYIAILRHLPEHTKSFEYFIDYYESEFENILSDHSFKNEIYYIGHYLISKGFIKKEELFSKIQSNVFPLLFVDIFDKNPSSISRQSVKSSFFYENLSSLSDNNWELHKKLVNAGVNPNPIAISIRLNDINSLKLYYSNPYFDPNMILEKSFYERTTISSKNLNLIEYSAFHNSIDCFDFLVQSSASNPFRNNSIFKFLICGNSPYLNRHKPSEYRDFLKYAIYYHNCCAIVNIIDDDDMEYDYDTINYAKLMIQFCEFEGLVYLLQSTPISISDLKELIGCAEENHNDFVVKIIQTIIRMK